MSRAIVRPAGEIVSRPSRGGLYLWILAPLVGLLVASAVVIFHALVVYGQFIAFGSASGRLASRLFELPWWHRLVGPLVGGAVLCLILRLGVSLGWGAAPRAYGLQDIVQNRRLRGTIRSTTLTLRDGFLSAVAAVVSLAWGGSAGREEPVTHLGATLAVLNGRLLGLDISARRMLLGMGAAAAISAALHAPIAGVFLARELILRNQRVSSLGPVAVASAIAWLVAMWMTNGRAIIVIPAPEIVPPEVHVAAFVILPLLALFAWLCKIAWARAPDMVAAAAGRIRLPLWLLPLPGGIALGVIGMAFPQVLGIGYEPLATGLNGNYGADLLPVLAVAKILATAVTFGFRWAGGAIAPALYVGAMIGAGLGVLVGLVLGIPAPQAFMGLVGMAVCVAVLLDAPLAATILVVELSGSASVGASSLLCCFIACIAVRKLSPRPAEDTGQTLRWR